MKIGRINELNRRLELQELVKNPDGAGGFVGQWITVRNIWGNIKMLSNIPNTTFSFLEIRATHLITVRKHNNININMRFLYNNDYYNIKYLNNLDYYFIEAICDKIS
ncbi:MAG: phage head closure protein [Rickettsiales bacterium]|jgi:SPP1 family predicted phage head-tail adaptor|nr:phage head closure protein [Rickettsiales bacterium]